MNSWWLALDLEHTSYEEVKHRKTIAQGWSRLGDLRTLYSLAKDPTTEQLFKDVIRELARQCYGEGDKDVERPLSPMWNLSQIQRGDLVVGIEGTMVRGICQAGSNATESYHFDASGHYEYAQTVCAPAIWREWNVALIGQPPRAPAQSVLGIRRLQSERQNVVEAWNNLNAQNQGITGR